MISNLSLKKNKNFSIFFIQFFCYTFFLLTSKILATSEKDKLIKKSSIEAATTTIAGLFVDVDHNASVMGYLWAEAQKAMRNPKETQISGGLVNGEFQPGFSFYLEKIKNKFTDAAKDIPMELQAKIEKDSANQPSFVKSDNTILDAAKIINNLFVAKIGETTGLMAKLNTSAAEINESTEEQIKKADLFGEDGFVTLFFLIKNKLEKAFNLLSPTSNQSTTSAEKINPASSARLEPVAPKTNSTFTPPPISSGLSTNQPSEKSVINTTTSPQNNSISTPPAPSSIQSNTTTNLPLPTPPMPSQSSTTNMPSPAPLNISPAPNPPIPAIEVQPLNITPLPEPLPNTNPNPSSPTTTLPKPQALPMPTPPTTTPSLPPLNITPLPGPLPNTNPSPGTPTTTLPLQNPQTSTSTTMPLQKLAPLPKLI